MVKRLIQNLRWWWEDNAETCVAVLLLAFLVIMFAWMFCDAILDTLQRR
jgi:predicted negative regulator of RcsB-dependent stress response